MFIYKRKYPYSLKEGESWTGIQGTSGVSVARDKVRDFISPEGKKRRDAEKQEAILDELSLVFSSKKDKNSITTFINQKGKRIRKAMKKVFPYITPKMEIKDDSIFLYELKNGAEVYYDFDNKIKYYLNGFFDNEADFVGYVNKNNKIDKKFLSKLFKNIAEINKAWYKKPFAKIVKDIYETKNTDSKQYVETNVEVLEDTMLGVAGITPVIEISDNGKGIVLFEIDTNGAEVSYDFENKMFVYYLNAVFTRPGEFSRYVKNLKQKITDNILDFTDGLIRKQSKSSQKQKPKEKEKPEETDTENKKDTNK